MKIQPQTTLTRREFLRTSLTGSISLLLAACGGQFTPNAAPAPGAQGQPANAPPTPAPPSPTQVTQSLPPTPACGDDDATPPQTEGPFFTPNSPERASLLEPGMAGTKMILTGFVFSTDCQPVAGALLDFWHADDSGAYDNAGYKLRGHQFADSAGRYKLETIVAGLYPGRTRHIHVKAQAADQPVLTSQLYFPGEPRNETDSIFNSDLLMDVMDAADGKTATFNFVLNIS